jgi:CheY-like chemotaxis protein
LHKGEKLKIIVAEDQLINMEVIKDLFEQINLARQCQFCYNGKETVECANKLIEDVLTSENEKIQTSDEIKIV